MPIRYRVAAEMAMLFIGNIREHLQTIALTSEEYFQALHSSADLGIKGGAVYDALLAQCALKSGAEIIYTWNLKHYAQCGSEVAKRLRTPPLLG